LPSRSVIASSRLLQLARELRTALDQAFAPIGLTSQQAGLLIHVYTGVTSPKEVAELLGTDSAGMTRMVDRLAVKDLLDRTPDPGDRRAIALRLTPTGSRLVRNLPPIFEQVAGRLTAGVDPDRLFDDLGRMIDNLARTDPRS
jgi:DNA-binding MarR family transcriptional regulator